MYLPNDREFIKTFNFVWINWKLILCNSNFNSQPTSSVSKLSLANRRKLLTISSNFLSALSGPVWFIARKQSRNTGRFLSFNSFFLQVCLLDWDCDAFGCAMMTSPFNCTTHPNDWLLHPHRLRQFWKDQLRVLQERDS